MSFILDALRKSEMERQKAQVPGIGDAPLVVRQKHVPRWTVGLIACLSAGLLVLGWFWLRDAGTGADRDMAAAPAQANSAAPAQANSAAAVAPQAVTGTSASSASQASPGGAADTVSFRPGEVGDLSEEALRGTVATRVAGGENVPAQPPPAVLAPEVLAAPMLTLAQYRATGGALPELNLELHVYSPAAAERFVFINSTKYVEGQTLTEGPRLGAITQDGAVLVHEGRSLLLPRE